MRTATHPMRRAAARSAARAASRRASHAHAEGSAGVPRETILRAARHMARNMARHMVAGYDAAQTTVENQRHWQYADALSADASASAAVRNTLRNRARYEVANNSYAKGMTVTLANDCIGTGPHLQARLDDPDANAAIEAAWNAWARETRLDEKLRTMRMAQSTDGEAFGVFVTNDRLRGPVKLDMVLVEADQVTDPALVVDTDTVDGIQLDPLGNPIRYTILDTHPGANVFQPFGESTKYPAAAVAHLFRADRPGQHRGVTEIAPALPLFAQLRRYTLAVIGAAETAASVGGVLKTNGPAESDDEEPTDETYEPLDYIDVVRNMLMTLPAGYDLSQYKAEQPTTTHEMFVRAILREIARCLNMPYNVAAGDSSGYNYASGRLDHQTYFRAIDIDRARIVSIVCDPIFGAWLREYWLSDTSGIALPVSVRRGDIPHEWQWDGRPHVDPIKEANASETRLRSNTTTLAAEYAAQGLDWEAALRQRARELTLMRELGLPIQTQTAIPAAVAPDDEEDAR